MVRKPVSHSRNQSATQAAPYPAAPVSPIQKQTEATVSPEISNSEEIARATEQIPEANRDHNSWLSNDNPWHNEDERATNTQLPPMLRAGPGIQNTNKVKNEGIPPTLQAGSDRDTPRSSSESQRSNDLTVPVSKFATQALNGTVPEVPPTSHPTNPYHRPSITDGPSLEQSGYGAESGAGIWNGNQDIFPWQEDKTTPRQPFTDPWMDFEVSPVESKSGGDKSTSGPFSGHETGATSIQAANADEVVFQPRKRGSRSQRVDAADHDPLYSTSSPIQGASLSAHNIGHERFDTSEDTAKVPLYTLDNDNIGPPLPPRTSQEKQEEPPPQPPRPPKTNTLQANDGLDEQTHRQAESTKSKRARETYQIRHVNWYDASSPTNPRLSPIMVQNANGPCPLLALVNALVLSTPANYPTTLVETLRVREQVSLGLLLDAVIEELIGRNGDLSNVSDMYAFLVTLHTGMNVNPRFIPSETTVNLMDAPIEEKLSGNLHGSRKAGGFEDTREMKLYSTFAIPLIHGWIPPRNHPAFAALERSAKSYEDAQNLMFREEELEEKLRQEGLNAEEQVTLEDIASVKYFLSSTATQLTGYGLDTITETMKPGSIAILFRNDHFSTLYRHPKSGQLLTLVTDMGYAGHDEVVWESLVDVSGEGCEFFSGDFRPVGNNSNETQQQPQSQHEEGWTTVPHRSRRPVPSNRQPSHSDLPPISTLKITNKETPLSPSTEELDHDLALAMQLQEEEEERDRQEAAARRRENELSQAYLNSSDASGRRTFPGFSTGATGAQGGPPPPPRGRGSRGRGRGARGPPAPPRKSMDGDDAPPPTYEQAAKGPAYHPPAHHPAHPHASPGPSGGGGGGPTPRPLPNRPHRQSSAYSEHASSYPFPSPSSPYTQQPQQTPRRGGPHNPRPPGSYPSGMRGGGGGGAVGGVDPGLVRRRTVEDEDERKEKDCLVM